MVAKIWRVRTIRTALCVPTPACMPSVSTSVCACMCVPRHVSVPHAHTCDGELCGSCCVHLELAGKIAHRGFFLLYI